MESVAKQSPIRFGRTDESIIGGIKHALDNNLEIDGNAVDEKAVLKMFKENQLVNINVTGRQGLEAAENTANKTNINNLATKKEVVVYEFE